MLRFNCFDVTPTDLKFELIGLQRSWASFIHGQNFMHKTRIFGCQGRFLIFFRASSRDQETVNYATGIFFRLKMTFFSNWEKTIFLAWEVLRLKNKFINKRNLKFLRLMLASSFLWFAYASETESLRGKNRKKEKFESE